MWISDKKELESLAVEYYRRLYSLEDVELVVDKLPSDGFARLNMEELMDLSKPVTPLEVEVAVRKMGRFKAPGPDGFQPVFHQECWEVVGESVVQFVLKCF